ncbi:MAG TPA: CBS domain-containing protein [Acetobacteraceae bacterium]|nr:CBS domain-containing protein [Acetobacteraceae bacterium]
MMISGILKHKGHALISVTPDMTIGEVAQVLGSRRIGAVLVLDAAEQLLGILSERDIVASLAEYGAAALDMTAAQLMTSEVQTATPGTSVNEAMSMMTDGRFRHIPVVENGRLVGLVSIGDVVKAKIGEAEQEVDSLRAYVAGAA